MGATAAEIEDVYRRDFDRFVRVAWSIVGDEDTAYDAVQDAFARALRHRRRFDGRGPLEAWIWRTVVNTALTRHARVEPRVDARTNGRAPDEGAAVAALVAALPERQRLAVFLRYYADLDYVTIAETMGVSPGTVGATLAAARDSLRSRILEVGR